MKEKICQMNKAFLLDRDGTINIDTGYVMSSDKVFLLDGVGEAIHKMNKAGYYVIVISNQSGVARGFGTEDDVHHVNKKIEELLKIYDAKIDAFYFCPHHEQGIIPKYKVRCDCRKPKIGMFKQAIKDFNLDPALCIAAGDNKRDVERLSEIGITKCAIINNENYFKSLLEFTEYILARE